MRVLVTGSREYDNPRWVYEVLGAAMRYAEVTSELQGIHLIVGDCPTGADKFARDWAAMNGAPMTVYAANWDLYGKEAGPIRNKKMVEEGAPDVAFAFYQKGAGNKGTENCARLALEYGVKVHRYT